MKVYCIINSNAEGSNFIGVYDSKAKADRECQAINDQLNIEAEAMNREELKQYGKIRFDHTTFRWDHCHVIEQEMNTRFSHTTKDYNDA